MFRLLRFGVKSGIAASAVYYTVDEGVWKDSETTEKLYNKIRNDVKPYVAPYISPYIKEIKMPFELPKLPETGNMLSTVQTTWNKGVINSFAFICEVPDLVCKYSTQGAKAAYSAIKDQLEAASVQNPPLPGAKE